MNPELQQKLVANLEVVFKARGDLYHGKTLADVMAEMFGCTKHSIYRRFRCETAFSMGELYLVCKHFNISADMLFGHMEHAVSFQCQKANFINNNPNDPFRLYLDDTLNTVNVLRSLSNLKMYIPGDDVFALLLFGSPHLTAFKLFYWYRSLLAYEPFHDRQFDSSILEFPYKAEAKAIYEAYSEISTVEIWNNDTLSKVMQQIKYYYDAGLITDRDILKALFNEILEIIEKVRNFAKAGKKQTNHTPGTFQLYYSEILSDNNGHLIQSDDLIAVALSHNIFNSLITYDERYINETRLWLDRMIQQSTLISSASERERSRLFKQLIDRVNFEMRGLGIL